MLDPQLEKVERRIFLHRKFTPRSRWIPDKNHDLLRFRRPNCGGALLDIGCGEGSFLAKVRNMYAVHGVDFDRDAIAAAKRFYGLDNVWVATPEDLKADSSGQYDLVTLFEVLEHVEEPRELLVTIRRLLAPGGVVAIGLPNRLRKGADVDPTDVPPIHLSKWTARSLQCCLESAGFEMVVLWDRKTQPIGFFESGGLLQWRLRSVVEPILSVLRKRVSHSTGTSVELITEDTVLSLALLTSLTAMSRALWPILWPWYFAVGVPSYGIYAEARV